MAARILAVLAAVGMVVAAIAYRQSLDDGDGGDGGGDGDAAVIVCAAELGSAVCEAAGATVIEVAATTAERLIPARSAAAAEIDAWVTPGPWGAMVDSARRSPLFEPRAATVAHSALVAVVRKGTDPGGCPRPLTWKCLGDAAQAQEFRLAADSSDHATGLLVRAAALAGFHGGPDYGRAEIEEGESATWLANLDARLDAAVGFQAGSFDQYVATQGAGARAFLTTGATARVVADSPTFDVAALEPSAAVNVVVSITSDRGRDAVDRERLADALVARGWERGAADGSGGLPEPGVLQALRESVR